MISVIMVLLMCIVMGMFLETMAKNKGYNYWRLFFLGFIPAIFPLDSHFHGNDRKKEWE